MARNYIPKELSFKLSLCCFTIFLIKRETVKIISIKMDESYQEDIH